MSTASDLKGIFGETVRVMEASLGVTEQFAALREAATEKGIDWGQLKALAKAQVLDAMDESGEGKHVEKIVEKADFALAYADMLGLAKMNENKSFPSAPVPPSSTPTSSSEGAEPPVASAAGERPRQSASPPSGAPDVTEDIPAFLKRGDPACPVMPN